MTPYRILFVRHGETDYNAEGRLQGQRDIPLNGKGREQASSIGRTLRKLMGPTIDAMEATNAFVSSPLGRTRETMSRVRAAMGFEPDRYAQNAMLKELTFGAWEGSTWPEIEARDPVGAKARDADKWNFVPPGGESYAMLSERLEPWLGSLTQDVFVVSHGGVARALTRLYADVPQEVAANVSIWQGRAIWFENGGYSWVG